MLAEFLVFFLPSLVVSPSFQQLFVKQSSFLGGMWNCPACLTAYLHLLMVTCPSDQAFPSMVKIKPVVHSFLLRVLAHRCWWNLPIYPPNKNVLNGFEDLQKTIQQKHNRTGFPATFPLIWCWKIGINHVMNEEVDEGVLAELPLNIQEAISRLQGIPNMGWKTFPPEKKKHVHVLTTAYNYYGCGSKFGLSD